MLNNRNLRTQLQDWSSYVFVVLIVGGGRADLWLCNHGNMGVSLTGLFETSWTAQEHICSSLAFLFFSPSNLPIVPFPSSPLISSISVYSLHFYPHSMLNFPLTRLSAMTIH